jgi:superfamily II DNA or RNA helicase
MPRVPTLTYDRGTLILHPPPRGKAWIDDAVWDDRVERFRIPALAYCRLTESLNASSTKFSNQAPAYHDLQLRSAVEMTPYPHQEEALQAWRRANAKGVVVLPTGAGKTYVAQLAMTCIQKSTLIVVPTLDLMHQWYAHLLAVFPDHEIGLLGGGSHDWTSVLVATYDSAAIHAEVLGNRYGLLIFDECHHLPSDFTRVIAEYALAPYRLGLTATPERSDGRHADFDQLIGPIVYRVSAESLSGSVLAMHRVVRIKVHLSRSERQRYESLIEKRNAFLKQLDIHLGSLSGWQQFVRASARSRAGRRAMLAHREARTIAFGTEGKLRVLGDLLAQHYPMRTLVFTDDNTTVYRIAKSFLLPAITHKTPVKERHDILARFKSGIYPVVVTSRVLNEGVDVPEATIAIVLSGTGSAREYTQRLGRILRQGDGKLALLYEVIAQATAEEHTARRRRSRPISYAQPISPELHLKVAESEGEACYRPNC